MQQLERSKLDRRIPDRQQPRLLLLQLVQFDRTCLDAERRRRGVRLRTLSPRARIGVDQLVRPDLQDVVGIQRRRIAQQFAVEHHPIG